MVALTARVAFDKLGAELPIVARNVRYDQDGSGEIEFDEFSDMVQELLKAIGASKKPIGRPCRP